MIPNVENSDGSLEGSSVSEDDFYSANDSPRAHSVSQTSAALLSVQLAIVCIRLHQCARGKNGVSRLPQYPIGLPPLKKRSKRYAESVLEGNLQDSSDSLIEESSIRKRSWCTSDDGHGYALKQLRSKKVLQSMSSQEHQTEQSLLKQELEAIQDGENLVCHSLWQDGGGTFLGISNQNMIDDEDDDYDNTVGRSFNKEIVEVFELTGRKLSQNLQPDSTSLSNLFKASSNETILSEQDKGGSWSSGIKFRKADDRTFPIEKSNLHDSSQATFVSSNGATISSSKVCFKSELEDASRNGGPEQGQTDSLLLWPVRLAVEAIAFQVRLIAQAFSLVAMLYDWCNSFASNRVRETWQAKERATESLSQKVAMITNVPPKVTESGSMVLKRAGWGCFAAVYVCILMSMLLFPTLILDYVFLSKVVEDPVNIKEPLHFDYTLPQPAAVVSLCPTGGKAGSHSECGRLILISHKVHISVLLTLPESDYNRELGMFQLSAELLSETGEVIKSSSRPCMLRFHSLPIRMLKTFLISLPSLMGMFTESQALVVHLMEFEEQRLATSAVKILVQPKAGMPLGQGIPEIYSAYVHIESHLPWLKNLVRKWKWTVYIWTGVMLYVVEIIVILCCCRQALMPKAWAGQNDEVKADQSGSPDLVEEDGSGPRNQLRKEQVLIRRHSLQDPTPIARAAALNRREGKLSLDALSSK